MHSNVDDSYGAYYSLFILESS